MTFIFGFLCGALGGVALTIIFLTDPDRFPPGGQMTDHELLQSLKSQIDAQLAGAPIPVPPVTPTPPVEPPPVIPPTTGGSCSGANDLSDKGEHINAFTEGQWQTFCFRCPTGGWVDLTVVPVAGTAAKTGHWIINNGPPQSFTPSGSDFRFKPVEGWLTAGTYQVQISVTGIKGEGRFGLQATGAVGP